MEHDNFRIGYGIAYCNVYRLPVYECQEYAGLDILFKF